MADDGMQFLRDRRERLLEWMKTGDPQSKGFREMIDEEIRRGVEDLAPDLTRLETVVAAGPMSAILQPVLCHKAISLATLLVCSMGLRSQEKEGDPC